MAQPPTTWPPPYPQRWRIGLPLLRGRRGRLALLGLLLAVSSALPLAGPQLLRAFIDQAVAGRPIAALALIAGTYVAVALSGQALAVAAAYGATQLAWTVTNDLRGLLLHHTLELDLSFHGTHPPGELIERTDGDVTALSTFVSSFVMRIVGSALTLTGVLVVVLLEDWRVGLALAAFAAVAAVTIARLRNSAVPQATERRAAVARLFGEIEERLAGAEDLRATSSRTSRPRSPASSGSASCWPNARRSPTPVGARCPPARCQWSWTGSASPTATACRCWRG